MIPSILPAASAVHRPSFLSRAVARLVEAEAGRNQRANLAGSTRGSCATSASPPPTSTRRSAADHAIERPERSAPANLRETIIHREAQP
jgi:hypothetical protein